MQEKSKLNSKSLNLNDLPESNDPYFTDYKADITRVEDKKPPKCEHYFFYYKAGQAECKNCHMGLYMEVGDLLKDGHLYRGNKLIV
jgi:hypothetical protein